MKKLLLFLVLLFSLNINAQGPPPKEDLPVLSNFRIESNEPSRVYFDSSKEITGSSKKGFVISGKTISKLSINSGQTTGHYFTVSKPFTFWDNNTIRLGENTDASDVNPILHNFTLSYIENNINEPTASTNKYVTTSARGGGNGDSESSAWTLTEAFANVTAGMTVWIKAGNYGNSNVIEAISGTANSPIKFIGYKSSIGDITSNYFDYGVVWDTDEMPTFTGTGTGKAIEIIEASYLMFKNIQFTNYTYGILSDEKDTNYIIIDRVNGNNFGYRFINIGYQNLSINHKWRNGNNVRILNSVGMNSEMTNFNVYGEGSILIDNVKSYCDIFKGSDAYTDYHIAINGDNCIIKNSSCKNNIVVSGNNSHGIGIRGDANMTNQWNLIIDCTSDNQGEGFYFRNYGTDNNVIKNCTVDDTINASPLEDRSRGIGFMNHVSNNIAENITVKNQGTAIFVSMNDGDADNEQPGSFPNQEDIGSGNIVRNMLSINNLIGFGGFVAIPGTSNIPDFKFYNNTFIGGIASAGLVYLDSDFTLSNIEFKNCIIQDMTAFGGWVPVVANNNGQAITDRAEIAFDYTSRYNNYNNWTPNGGTGNILEDADLDSNKKPQNVALKVAPKLFKVQYDINNVERDSPTTIGAVQIDDNSTGLIEANAGEDKTICNGESTTLTASGGSTYEWSTGETTPSIDVSPSSTQTYTVTAKDENITDQDEVTVTVNTVTAGAGADVTINEGESTTLTASGGGTYLWSTGETTESISVSPIATEIFEVRVSKNGCEDTDEVVVTVNTSIGSVTANAGLDQTICLGESVTLTASGGSTYSWSTGATTKSIAVNPNITTTYTVTVSEGGASGTDSVQVTVNNVTANAGSDKTIDQGESVKLTASGGETYLWSTGESTKSITVSPITTKTYTVITTINGCEDNDSVEVTVMEIEISNPPSTIASAGDDISICLGESITLTADGGGSYTWSTGANQKIIQVNPTRTTIYTLEATTDGIKTIDSVMVSVENCNISSTNQDELQSELVVYPNPSKGGLNIKVSGQDGKELNLVLISVNGKIVYRDKMNPNLGTITKQINLSGLAKGIYYVKLFNSNQNMIKKILMI